MLSFVSIVVLAHTGAPLAYDLQEFPNDPQHLLAGTNFGVLLSNDEGATWQWVCDDAIGSGSGLQPVWYINPNGAIFAASFKGLFVSHDHGCNWEIHRQFDVQPDGGNTGVADLKSSGSALYAVTAKYGVVNRAWRSTDVGATFTELPVASDVEFYTTVRTAPSRPQRVYIAAWWFRPMPTAALYWSDDSGDTFNRIDATGALPALGAFYVYAVDPTNPEVVYGSLAEDLDPRRSFLVRSSDHGGTWQTLLQTADPHVGFVVSDDGSTLWLATSGRVHRSTDRGATFVELDVPTRYSCVDRFADRLYACGWHEVDGFAIGRSVSGGDFSPALTWKRVTGVVECPGTKVEAVCAPFFPALQSTFPKLPGEDGDAGIDGGPNTMPPMKPCGCSTAGAELCLTLLAALCRFSTGHALRRRRVHG